MLRPTVPAVKATRLAGRGAPWNDAGMTEHRPWFATWRDGVPKTLEPYPEVSVFSLLG